MPTDTLARTAALLLALALAGCGSGAGLDRDSIPLSMRGPYQRFEARCSRCHSLSRPLSAPVHSVAHWEHYLARMRRMPGSGINSADAELILQFLTYYTTVARGGGTTGGEVPSEHGAALAGSSHAQPASAEETHDAR